MTMGNDSELSILSYRAKLIIVSPLFPDIIQCMQIQVLEIKKSGCCAVNIWWRVADGQWSTSTWSTMGVQDLKKSRELSLHSYQSVETARRARNG